MNPEDAERRRQAVQTLLTVIEDQKQQIEDLLKLAEDNLEIAKSWEGLCLDMQSAAKKQLLLELRTAMRAHVLCFLFVVVFLLYFLLQELWLGAASQALLLLLNIHDILKNQRLVETLNANASKENS